MNNKENGAEARVFYEFGAFRLDAARHLLYAGDSSTPLAIKPKVLEALLYFVQHPGELLDKDRLLAELWPGVVVEENGLTQVISTLRRVLGEAPGENRYLATIPGRGYRFVAEVVRGPVHGEEPATAAPHAPEPPPATPQWSQTTTTAPDHRRWLERHGQLLAALALVAAVVAVGIAFYAWRPMRETDGAPAAASPGTADLPARSVAVLPFENLSADAGDAFVAFGVAESVLHRLAAIRGLTVIARTSSFARGANGEDVRGIGRDLNARYLVEGSVQRFGERLRVTTQLIDASIGAHVWSLRFDRSMDDIFAVEDEIARNIAAALEVSLDAAKHPYARFGTDAYLEYLQGRALLATNRIEDAERAMGHFNRAIEIAPQFAAAYAALANAHWQSALLQQSSGTGLAFMIRSDRQREQLAAGASEAQPLLDRALQLDDTLAEAYVLRADLKTNAGDFAGAEADYRTGLQYNPSYGPAHERYASLLWHIREDDAMAEVDQAIRVDPLAPRNHYLKGVFAHSSRRPDAAEPHFLKALAVDPDYHPALLRLGLIRWTQGRFAEAIRLSERALSVDPRAEWIRWPLTQFYLEVGEVDAARSVLLEAPETVPPYDWLAICLHEGKPQRAADFLRADPSFRYFVDLDIRAYALRDAARASGRFAETRQQLLVLPSYLTPPDREPFTLAALAHVNLALGDKTEAESLARELLDADDDYPRAAALTLLGQHAAALDLLEESYLNGFHAGGGRSRWWYVFQQDMGFATLHSDPRFQALAVKAKAHAAAERESLQKMRERGQVRARPPDASTGNGPC